MHLYAGVSIVDATSLIVYVAATAFGLTGAETPDEIEARPGVMDKLEALRRRAGVLLGLGATPEAVGLQTPRIAMVAAPASFKALDGETRVKRRRSPRHRPPLPVDLTSFGCVLNRASGEILAERGASRRKSTCARPCWSLHDPSDEPTDGARRRPPRFR
ncbi:hypothetical protein BOSEA31B_13842 [Hyphomicrobiales bacterium]|nr:hypothetical protein BOSEA31B_13842 [Hyphomicrobiales bacterium]CAH1699618.1 hypothetical protein BOSEA1005_12671 [Hyphomicrobiales bacterium]CAI0343970.1 hypothetical protein BO1005MUT1_300166 [Hyphomicrobiales bacterium]